MGVLSDILFETIDNLLQKVLRSECKIAECTKEDLKAPLASLK